MENKNLIEELESLLVTIDEEGIQDTDRAEELRELIHKQVLHTKSTSLHDLLVDRFETVLTKNYKYQMGDDEFQPTTDEMRVVDAVQIILSKIKK